MGYQEYILKSNKRSAEECAAFLTAQISKKDLHLEVVGTTKLKEDLSASKITFLGKPMEIDPINLKAGDEFVILAGERDYNLNRIFPLFERSKVEFYPADYIMQSDSAKDRDWNDLFIDNIDSDLESTEKINLANEEPLNKSNKEQLQHSVIHDDLLDTNIGQMPIEDYQEIIAMQNGFDSYEDMKAEGYHIDNEVDSEQNSVEYVPSRSLATRMMESENVFLPDQDYSVEL